MLQEQTQPFYTAVSNLKFIKPSLHKQEVVFQVYRHRIHKKYGTVNVLIKKVPFKTFP
jgi:hypothetical protein